MTVVLSLLEIEAKKMRREKTEQARSYHYGSCPVKFKEGKGGDCEEKKGGVDKVFPLWQLSCHCKRWKEITAGRRKSYVDRVVQKGMDQLEIEDRRFRGRKAQAGSCCGYSKGKLLGREQRRGKLVGGSRPQVRCGELDRPLILYIATMFALAFRTPLVFSSFY